MQNRVYFDNETNTWSIVTKRVDMTTYNVIYEQQQGFRSEEEATKVYEESLEKYKKDIEKIRKIDTNFYTFQQYLEYWFHHVLPLYSSSKGYKVTAECAIYHFIIPQIETDIPLSKVTPEYINNLLRDFERTNNVSIAFSCKKFIMVALRSAIAEGLLKQFPFDAVRKVPAPKARYVKYTKEQLQTLFNAVKNNSSIFPEFLLFLFCGLRTGEVLGLEYSAIDFKNGTIKIKQQINRDSFQVDEKTGNKTISPLPPKTETSYRTIKAPDLVIKELKKRKKENQAYFKLHPEVTRKYDKYVCIGDNGYIKHCATLSQCLKRICIKSGLPVITAHGLRHLCATLLLEEGFPVESISKILGHASPAITFSVYCGTIMGEEDIRNNISDTLDPMKYYMVSGV